MTNSFEANTNLDEIDRVWTQMTEAQQDEMFYKQIGDLSLAELRREDAQHYKKKLEQLTRVN